MWFMSWVGWKRFTWFQNYIFLQLMKKQFCWCRSLITNYKGSLAPVRMVPDWNLIESMKWKQIRAGVQKEDAWNGVLSARLRRRWIITKLAPVELSVWKYANSHCSHLFDFSPLCVFSNVSSKRKHNQIQTHIGHIFLKFLYCEFSNVSS